MNIIQTRNISFSSIKSLFTLTASTPGTKLEKPLTSLPMATGNGAFVEPITYQVLGSSSNLLNIKLPKSSILNIRYSNSQQKIVAMNGHITSMYTELARLKESNLIFQRCFNEKEPMSFLMANNAQNSNFAILDNTKANWVVRRSSLFAWSGPSIKPSTISKAGQSLLMKGDGTFIISTPGQIIQVDLTENESIQVNTKTIVAYTSNSKSESVPSLESEIESVVNLSIGIPPFLMRFNWIKKYIQIPQRLLENPNVKPVLDAISTLSTTFNQISTFIKENILPQDKTGTFIELKGPKTVFLTNSVHINDKILTDSEIKNLIA